MIIVIQMINESFSQPTNKSVNYYVYSASPGKRDNYRYLAYQNLPTLAESEVAAPPSQKPTINPLNAELNPIYHLLALLVHHILHVS